MVGKVDLYVASKEALLNIVNTSPTEIEVL